MVFSSYLFIFYFLPLSLLLYYPIPSRRARHFLLTILSYVFYGWANPKFVPLMFLSTLIDYLAGLFQAYDGWRGWNRPTPVLTPGGPRTRRQKLALVISIGMNLSLLGFFKYFNFTLDNYHAVLQWLGWNQPQAETWLRVTLPLGISFYTFQSMSYAIDVYRGETQAMRSFNDYFCFVAMYQQLVAGPIVRFSEIADQLRGHTHAVDKFARGVALFSLGLAMKVLLANPCGKIADTVWNAGPAHVLDAWYGLLAYSFQIYFDFAGYSEMAIGLGLLLGFVFAKNFETPYRSASLTDFWRRWHISLSSWLRDYLYIPLGGNRLGEARTYFNLMLTMLLGGLWHGASWNFLIWGGIHGGMLAFERTQGQDSLYHRLPHQLRVGLTFSIVLLSWVFFRAADLPSAISYLGSLVGWTHPQAGAGLLAGVLYQPYYLLSFAIAAATIWTAPTIWDFTQRLTWPKAACCCAALWMALVILLTQAYNPFIYFIF